MASSDRAPSRGPMAPSTPSDVPGEPISLGTSTLEKGAKILQSLAPTKQFQQHVCSFAFYYHDMTRSIETHHYVAHLNEDFLQCAVFDSDESNARLIGVEYIVSERLFAGLPEDEQKLWHSHFYEISTGVWITPGVPEAVQKPELNKMPNTYGKFWCTWQYDRGDRIPLGVPALMMSPHEVHPAQVDFEQIKARDKKYGVQIRLLAEARAHYMRDPGSIHPNADYWTKSGKGFVVELKEVDMQLGPGRSAMY